MGLTFLVCTEQPWGHRVFDKVSRRTPVAPWAMFLPSEDRLDAAELLDGVRHVRPRYAFFLDWTREVPEEVLAETECVGFWCENRLAAEGQQSTMVCARLMEPAAGSLYLRHGPISLDGTPEDVTNRLADTVAGMMSWIAEFQPAPKRDSAPASAADLNRLEEAVRW